MNARDLSRILNISLKEVQAALLCLDIGMEGAYEKISSVNIARLRNILEDNLPKKGEKIPLIYYVPPGFDVDGAAWDQYANLKESHMAFSGIFSFFDDSTLLIKAHNPCALDISCHVRDIQAIDHSFGQVHINISGMRRLRLWSLTPKRDAVLFWAHAAYCWIYSKKEQARLGRGCFSDKLNINIRAERPRGMADSLRLFLDEDSIKIPFDKTPHIKYEILAQECRDIIADKGREKAHPPIFDNLFGDHNSSAKSCDSPFDHIFGGGETESIRIYELARLLKKTNTEIITIAELLGVPAKSYSSSLSADSANKIIVHLRSDAKCEEPSSQGLSVATPTVQTLRRELYHHTSSDANPGFCPSKATTASLISRSEDSLQDLIKCLSSNGCIQSFWSDLILLHPKDESLGLGVVLNDETLHVPPFDESLYCQLVIENHRYSLAELFDSDQVQADKYAARGFKWGSLYGLFTLNPLLPFVAANQARASAPRHKKIEELIPDPKLLFLQDTYSLLAMTQAGMPLPRLRRVILHPIFTGEQVFVRALPAILTHDSVIPCQVFSCGTNYFMRPVCAGIDHEQTSYNARQIHRQYYHLRSDGVYADTGFRVQVHGADIGVHRYKLYKFTCDTRELEYYYIDYPTEPAHVF